MFAAILFAHVAAEEPATDQKDIWREIQGKPNPALMDNFEIIEGFTLPPMVKGISAQAAVLGAVINYQLKPAERNVPVDPIVMAYSQILDALIQELSKDGQNVTDDKVEFLQSFMADRLKGAADRVRTIGIETMRAMQGKDTEYKTEGTRASLFMQAYANGHTMEEALHQFADEMCQTVQIQSQERPSWDTLKEAIDKSIPVILNSAANACVAVGYYVSDGERHVFIYDPTRSDYRIANGLENVPKRILESKDPTQQADLKYRANMKIYHDHRVDLSRPLPPGLEVWTLAGCANYRALYVHTWKLDCGGLRSEMIQYLKQHVKKEPTK